MEKALAIANYLINKGVFGQKPLTQMKLQKLMYFAHGWNLALYDEPLVDTEFQAWKYGPVIPSVYQEFKEYGLLGISRQGTELVSTAQGDFVWEYPQIENTKKVHPLLEKIWDVFGKYSGNQLSAMTHLDDSPWRIIYDKNPGAKNLVIPNELIKKYFTNLIK